MERKGQRGKEGTGREKGKGSFWNAEIGSSQYRERLGLHNAHMFCLVFSFPPRLRRCLVSWLPSILVSCFLCFLASSLPCLSSFPVSL